MSEGEEAVHRSNSGTMQVANMIENIGANAIQFKAWEVAELNRSILAIQIRSERLQKQCRYSQAWKLLKI
jgi:hypothetical protein